MGNNEVDFPDGAINYGNGIIGPSLADVNEFNSHGDIFDSRVPLPITGDIGSTILSRRKLLQATFYGSAAVLLAACTGTPLGSDTPLPASLPPSDPPSPSVVDLTQQPEQDDETPVPPQIHIKNDLTATDVKDALLPYGWSGQMAKDFDLIFYVPHGWALEPNDAQIPGGGADFVIKFHNEPYVAILAALAQKSDSGESVDGFFSNKVLPTIQGGSIVERDYGVSHTAKIGKSSVDGITWEIDVQDKLGIPGPVVHQKWVAIQKGGFNYLLGYESLPANKTSVSKIFDSFLSKAEFGVNLGS